MDEKILEKSLHISEQFFGTAKDPDQMPITKESFYTLQRLHEKTVIYKLENNEPISWVVVLPTSKDLAEQFLTGKINERQLLDLSKPQKKYEALYLCAAFTVPEHRRKGLVVTLFKEAVEAIPHTADATLFAWIFSEEGRGLVKKMEKDLGIKIKTKE